MLEDSGDANSVRTGWPARLIGVLLLALGLVLAIGGIVPGVVDEILECSHRDWSPFNAHQYSTYFMSPNFKSGIL